MHLLFMKDFLYHLSHSTLKLLHKLNNLLYSSSDLRSNFEIFNYQIIYIILLLRILFNRSVPKFRSWKEFRDYWQKILSIFEYFLNYLLFVSWLLMTFYKVKASTMWLWSSCYLTEYGILSLNKLDGVSFWLNQWVHLPPSTKVWICSKSKLTVGIIWNAFEDHSTI